MTLRPPCWFRNIDDTYVIWPHGPDRFLDHLNGIHGNIQFTKETQTVGTVDMLIVLSRTKSSSLIPHVSNSLLSPLLTCGCATVHTIMFALSSPLLLCFFPLFPFLHTHCSPSSHSSVSEYPHSNHQLGSFIQHIIVYIFCSIAT